jgi:site-specific recombinase XerD
MASTKIRLEEFLASWMTSKKTTMTGNTGNHYAQLIRKYVAPRIGKIKLRAIRPEHIQAFYNRLFEDQVGISTIRKIHDALHSSLQQATKTGMISRNPASFVRPPKKPAIDMEILNESQVSQFLIAAQGHPWEALFHLAVISGMHQMGTGCPN